MSINVEDDHQSVDELQLEAPLLGGDPDANDREVGKAWHIASTSRAISTIACIAIFLWVFSGMITVVPAAHLAQDILCRIHYGRADRDPIGAELCKAEEVQSAMAWILGLAMSLGTAVGLFATIPYGILADRARKPVYVLAAAGQFCNVLWSLCVLRFWRAIPIEWILLGPALELIGGGLTMALVILYSIISDVNAPEDRAVIYFFSSLAANLAVFIGSPLASIMIETWSPWVPMMMSLVSTTLAAFIISLIPETAHSSRKTHSSNDGSFAVKDQPWRLAVTSQLRSVFSNSSLRASLMKRSVLLLLLVSFLAAPLQLGTGPLFIQYYSKRFSKSIEQAGYMLAIRGGLTIVVVGILLPALSRYIGNRTPTFRRDLAFAQASAAFAGIGYFLLGGPETASILGLITLSLSAGLGPLGRSLLSNLVDATHTSQVFTIASIVEGVGSLPAGPFLAWIFSQGMRVGGFWMGLPFFFLGCLGVLASAALYFVKPEPSSG